MLEPNIDLVETLALCELVERIRKAQLVALLSVQGLDIVPPTQIEACLTYAEVVSHAADAVDALAYAAAQLSLHLRERVITMIGELPPGTEGVPMPQPD